MTDIPKDRIAPSLKDIKVGDTVTRLIGNKVPMQMVVTKIDDYIHCGISITPDSVTEGWWKFSKLTGAEIDERFGWDDYKTGSILHFPKET